MVFKVYRHKLVYEIRGFPPPTFIYIWDESMDNGKVVQAQNDRAKMVFENKGIFNWDVIVLYVKVSENFNYESFAGIGFLWFMF